MRKLFSFAAIVLSIMLIVVSCAPASLQNDASDKVDLYFGYLDAKAVNTDIYDSSGEAEWGSATVLVGTVDDYYWSYTAEKTDKLLTYGATLTQLSCSTGTGLGGARSFSKGDWEFTLYAYKSAEERTGGEKYIYTGTASGSFTSDQSVSIGMNYAYGNGTGTASFSITTSIAQDQPDKAITAYKITKIEAVIGDETVALSNSSGNTWTGTKDLTSGAKSVGLKVYVENETTPIVMADSLGTAYILHGLTTEIAGTATISFKDARRTVNFSATIPEEQPVESGFQKPKKSIVVGSTAPADVAVGDTLIMGSYNEVEIDWQVLEVDDENARALVISKDILAYGNLSRYGSISDDDVDTYLWSESICNHWLNESDITISNYSDMTEEEWTSWFLFPYTGTFIELYGLSDICMVQVDHVTGAPDIDGASSEIVEETTNEKIFLLSYEEIITYFPSASDRIAYLHDGLIDAMEMDESGNFSEEMISELRERTSTINCWFTRTPYMKEQVLNVNYDGTFFEGNVGFRFDQEGIRPAFWIEIE